MQRDRSNQGLRADTCRLPGAPWGSELSSPPFVFSLNPLSAFFLSVPILQEIRQLQQKQASYIRDISDLQETIEWKDKKIGVGLPRLCNCSHGQSADTVLWVFGLQKHLHERACGPR